MGQVIVTTLVDDIDGKEATETIQFGFDGEVYEIDLTEEHAAELRESLSYYVQFARAQRRPAYARKPGKAKVKVGATTDPAVIRAWAVEQGLQVSKRGRLNADIVAAFHAGH